LYAISQLRFPAGGPGGHDFYYDGKVTNRSGSFSEHRQHIAFVLRIYKRSTVSAEDAVWYGVEEEPARGGRSAKVVMGAPVIFDFSERLSQETFDAFVKGSFQAKSKFRLWGNPISLGPLKVHVYALDRHLWQPLFFEITDRKMVVIVPKGTCGNTIHRLVTNVQQYLDPRVTVYVGDRNYTELIDASHDAARDDDEKSS
jgi:hypothetical protein